LILQIPIFVFVYGTLRKGQRNDINLYQPQPLYMGSTWVKGQLHSRGWYPGIRLGGEHKVWGEVYQVSAHLLAQLDVLEEVAPVPSGEYQRIQMEVECAGQKLVCEIYELSEHCAAQSTPIAEGDWVKFVAQS
jgi:gamma-glutamylcyclotransferase (GGCT)/AIG2-like uncharacterized protein YtfP